jgi:HSP90 family molecular chaperone
MKKKGEMEEKWGHDSKLWNEFVKSIKLGIIEEATDRNRLAKLLSFERFV